MRYSAIFAIMVIIILSVGLTSYTAYSQIMLTGSQPDNFAIVQDNTQVTLSGEKSTDPQDFPLSYSWTQVSGDSVKLGSKTGEMITFVTPTVKLGETKYLVFSLTVNNSHSGKSTATYTLEVIHNNPPVVTTTKQIVVAENTVVSLTGSASDPDGDPVSLQWVQTSGEDVMLSSSDSPTATFIAPMVDSVGKNKVLTFSLNGDDGRGGKASDTEQVTVIKLTPVQVSCPDLQKAMPGDQITISPQVDNPYNSPLTFVWRQGSGDTIPGLVTDKQVLTFLVPLKVHGYELSFMFNVYEGPFLVANCESYIYFSYIGEYNLTREQIQSRDFTVANAGPDETVQNLSTVTLDGSKSVGKNLQYTWIQTGGESVTLLNSNTAYPSFVAPDVAKATQKDLEFTLIINNALGHDSDTVHITVINPASPPTARIILK